MHTCITVHLVAYFPSTHVGIPCIFGHVQFNLVISRQLNFGARKTLYTMSTVYNPWVALKVLYHFVAVFLGPIWIVNFDMVGLRKSLTITNFWETGSFWESSWILNLVLVLGCYRVSNPSLNSYIFLKKNYKILEKYYTWFMWLS